MKLRMSCHGNRWFIMAGLLISSVSLWATRAAETSAANHPGWPGLHDNQTWIAADPSSTCRVDGLFGNYGKTWRKHYAGYAQVIQAWMETHSHLPATGPDR
jgi:hypothetical protein